MRALICLFVFFSFALLVAPVSIPGAFGFMAMAVCVAFIEDRVARPAQQGLRQTVASLVEQER